MSDSSNTDTVVISKIAWWCANEWSHHGTKNILMQKYCKNFNLIVLSVIWNHIFVQSHDSVLCKSILMFSVIPFATMCVDFPQMFKVPFWLSRPGDVADPTTCKVVPVEPHDDHWALYPHTENIVRRQKGTGSSILRLDTLYGMQYLPVIRMQVPFISVVLLNQALLGPVPALFLK